MKLRINPEERSGTVLIIVVGILAVLMLLGATLALTSRVELKTTENYEYRQEIDRLAEAVEQYTVDVVEADKYGSNGVPYDYEKFSRSGDIYPARSATDNLDGDDENFDSYLTEEWLPEFNTHPARWRLFNGLVTSDDNTDTDNDARLWGSQGAGYHAIWRPASWVLGGQSSDLMGGEVRGEFALYFFDAGGERLDVNMTGNSTSETTPDAQNQGLSPFEIRLRAIGLDPKDAASIVSERNRLGIVPDEHHYGSSAGLDYNADSTMDADPLTTTPVAFGCFNPEDPAGREWPYAAHELHDLLWRTDTGSRLKDIPSDYKGLLTTRSNTTILAGRSIRGSAAFTNTNPDTTHLGGYAGMQYNGTDWLRSGEGKDLILQRALQDIVGDLTSANNAQKVQMALDLADLMFDLGPEVLPGQSPAPTADEQRVILTQIAFNIIDMLDVDSSPTYQEGVTIGSLGSYDFYGVEPTPYIVEVEGAIDTLTPVSRSFFPVDPNPGNGEPDAHPEGDIATVGTRLDSSGDPAITRFYDRGGDGQPSVQDEVWLDLDAPGTSGYRRYNSGEPRLWIPPAAGWGISDGGPPIPPRPHGNQNNPPMGWGKYVKLHNPSGQPIDLGGYRLVLPLRYPYGSGLARLRRWTFHPDHGGWHSDGVPGDLSLIDDHPVSGRAVVVNLSGTLQPGQHGIVVDYDGSDGPFGSVTGHIVGHHRYLNYMQEAKGEPQHTSHLNDAFADNGGPSVVELYDPQDRLIQRFEVFDPDPPHGGGGQIEDDWDDTPAGDVGQTRSTQIGDPRPCWWKNVNDVAAPPSLQSVPWAMGEANLLHATYHEWALPPQNVPARWFNANWRRGTGPNVAVPTGDAWRLLHDDLTGADDLLDSFCPVQLADKGVFPSPGAIGYVHAGIPWGTLSLTNASGTGAQQVVYLRNFTDYVMGPVSPHENGVDDDGDQYADERPLVDESDESPNDSDGINNDGDFQADSGSHGNWSVMDHSGPEIRRAGRVNVNTASEPVLRAVLKRSVLEDWARAILEDQNPNQAPTTTQINNRADVIAEDIGRSIIYERRHGKDINPGGGPYSSVDDLFERVPELFGSRAARAAGNNWEALFSTPTTPVSRTSVMTELPADWGSFHRREALARFMGNLLTVRTDVWAAVGRVRLLDNDTGEEIVSKGFYVVIDRSFDPARIVLRRELEF